MLGYKFDEETINIILSRWGQGKYRYNKSKKGKANLRVRLYLVCIYYIFKNLKSKIKNKKIKLDICRDFNGREFDIKQFLYLYLSRMGFVVDINFTKLSKDSIADKYAFLIKNDSKNLMNKYLIKIKISEIECFLEK